MPGLIPPQKLEEIRAASDIVDVIGGYLGPLKRAGGNFVTLCPFHREKSPSFNVNPGRQIFHCFGCHKGGDVFTFVKEYESLSFIEAVRRLAERARIVLEFEDNPHAKQARGEKESLLHIHEEICKRWQAALANDAAGQIARDYLAKRGVSAEALKLFRLGYAPDLWDDTVNWAKSKNFALPLVERGGLIIRKEGADHFYDRFRGRLMFPICDEQGRVIAFSGRVLAGDEKTAKYVNSPETPLFKKGKVLFALDKARRSILDAGCAVVCEGQLDTISCHSHGISHVVAPQGTALTAQHVSVLRRYTDDIILCFDGDNAGRKAAARGFDELVDLGVPFRVAEIPSPHDPDSYLKSFGQKAFFELLVNAKDFFNWYLDYLIQINDIAHDRGRLAVMRGMFDVLAHPKNLLLVDIHLQKTAARLQVSEGTLRAEFKKHGSPKATSARQAHSDTPPDDYYDSVAPSAQGSVAQVVEESPPSKQEFWLLQALFHCDDDQMEWLANTLRLEWLVHFGVRQIVALRLSAYANQSWQGPSQLLGELPDDATRSLCTQAMAESDRMLAAPIAREGADAARAARIQAEREKARVAMLRDVLTRLRNDFIDRRMTELNRDINNPALTEAEHVAAMQESAQLRQQKKQPL